jgi:hypothetical protein
MGLEAEIAFVDSFLTEPPEALEAYPIQRSSHRIYCLQNFSSLKNVVTQRTNRNLNYATRLKLEELSLMRYEMQRFFMGEAFDLYEGQRFIARLAPECAAVEISFGKLVLACWGEGWSHSWRVTACEWRNQNLHLHCTKRMGSAQAVLLLQRAPLIDSCAETRAEFAEKIAGLIEMNLRGYRVEQVIHRGDEVRHFSGIRARLILKARGSTVAGIALSERESQDNIDATLGEGLLWLEELRRRGRKVRRLAVLVPCGKASTIACRLTCLRFRGAAIGLYEIDESAKQINPVAAFEQADLADHLQRAARRAEWAKPHRPSAEALALIEQARQLAPEALETRQRSGWIHLAIRGLSFARVSLHKAVVEFGLHPPRKKLTQANRQEFAALIRRINSTRQADADNRGDPIFRAQAEGWLESVVRQKISLLDPGLDPRFLYSQVPAYRGEQRAFIDLLAVTRRGRLVIMELKVSEDAELPFQGLDYWLRIDWHRRRGDFERRGYFKGLGLSDEAPLIYLVAPLFRFHATTKLLAATIAREAPVYRIGINEDWRKDLRVLLSERLN